MAAIPQPQNHAAHNPRSQTAQLRPSSCWTSWCDRPHPFQSVPTAIHPASPRPPLSICHRLPHRFHKSRSNSMLLRHQCRQWAHILQLLLPTLLHHTSMLQEFTVLNSILMHSRKLPRNSLLLMDRVRNLCLLPCWYLPQSKWWVNVWFLLFKPCTIVLLAESLARCWILMTQNFFTCLSLQSLCIPQLMKL